MLPVLAVAGLGVLVAVVAGDDRTWMAVALSAAVVAGYAISTNVVLGLSGQLLLCIGALGAVGGYGTAVLADDVGWPPVVAVGVAVGVAAAVGAGACWLSVRRSLGTIFTGIVTLAFALGVEALLLGQRTLTGGEDGRVVAAAGDTSLRTPVGGYLAMLGVVVLGLSLHQWLTRSRHGLALQALRDDATTAGLAGVDVGLERVLAGAVGAAVAGLVGAVDGLAEGRLAVDVHAFAVVDVGALLAVAVGGVGRLLAPVVGAVALGLLDEFVLRELGTLRTAVLGVVLVVLFRTLPDGVLGAADRGRGVGTGARTRGAGSSDASGA